jgi:hypothetical protein
MQPCMRALLCRVRPTGQRPQPTHHSGISSGSGCCVSGGLHGSAVHWRRAHALPRSAGATSPRPRQRFHPHRGVQERHAQIRTPAGLHQRKGSRIHCWASSYRLGEFINSHPDTAGTIQVLVCRRSPRSADNCGHLVVNGTSLVLVVGDAVVFDATRLDHHTTPLVATDEHAEPQGMVLVGPYFLRGSGPARN